MSTYMQLIIEVTTGDDLVLDPLKKNERIDIQVGPGVIGLGRLDTVEARVQSVHYIPEEEIE